MNFKLSISCAFLCAFLIFLPLIATNGVGADGSKISGPHFTDIIVTTLGDPDGEMGVLKKGDDRLDYDGVLHVNQVVEYFS